MRKPLPLDTHSRAHTFTRTPRGRTSIRGEHPAPFSRAGRSTRFSRVHALAPLPQTRTRGPHLRPPTPSPAPLCPGARGRGGALEGLGAPETPSFSSSSCPRKKRGPAAETPGFSPRGPSAFPGSWGFLGPPPAPSSRQNFFPFLLQRPAIPPSSPPPIPPPPSPVALTLAGTCNYFPEHSLLGKPGPRMQPPRAKGRSGLKRAPGPAEAEAVRRELGAGTPRAGCLDLCLLPQGQWKKRPGTTPSPAEKAKTEGSFWGESGGKKKKTRFGAEGAFLCTRLDCRFCCCCSFLQLLFFFFVITVEWGLDLPRN